MSKRGTYLTDCKGNSVEEGDLIIFENAIPDPENWYDEYTLVVLSGHLMPKKPEAERDNVMISLIGTGRQRQYNEKLPESHCKFLKVDNLELPTRKGGLLVYTERPAF